MFLPMETFYGWHFAGGPNLNHVNLRGMAAKVFKALQLGLVGSNSIPLVLFTNINSTQIKRTIFCLSSFSFQICIFERRHTGNQRSDWLNVNVWLYSFDCPLHLLECFVKYKKAHVWFVAQKHCRNCICITLKRRTGIGYMARYE